MLPAIFILLAVSPAGAEERVYQVQAENMFPPYQYVDKNGEAAGFSIDILNAISDVVNIKFDIHSAPWSENRKMLENGNTDILAAMYYSKERDLLVDFSVPYHYVTFALFVLDSSSISGLSDIRGKTIAVSEGGRAHDYLLNNSASEVIAPVQDNLIALQKLASGECDAALLTKIQGLYHIDKQNMKSIRIIPDILIPQDMCFAVKDGDIETATILNEGLNIIKQNGTYDRLYDSWFSILERQSFFQRFRYRFIAVITLVTVLIILIMFWNRSLNVSVKIRTETLNKEIFHRIKTEKKLEESLKEKEILLSEIHHRVNNNLQIIIGLLELQQNGTGTDVSGDLIPKTQNQIRSIALIHEHLYSSNNFSEIDIETYISDLVKYISGVYKLDQNQIELTADIVTMKVPYEKAVTLGLIISEIFTNSIKHAFPDGREGRISVSAEVSQGKLVIELSDNGIGLAENEEMKNGTGLRLIENLTAQLGGSIKTSKQHGVRYNISLPLKEIIEQIRKPVLSELRDCD